MDTPTTRSLGKATFGGQTIGPNNVLIGYTFAGDANLDGRVNALDFSALASDYGASGVWVQGDFNYDGKIDTSDFAMLSTNFGDALPVALGAVVPEPAMALVVFFAAVIIPRRRVANLKV